MKKVLFVMRNLVGGGAEKVLIDILNEIDYNKYNIDLLLIEETGVYLSKVNKNVNMKSIIPINKFSNKLINRVYRSIVSRTYSKFPKLIANLFIGKKYDIEIAFLEGGSTKFLYQSPNKNSKKIGWIHSDLKKHRQLSMDKIICVSQQSKDSFIELYPQYKHKVDVIYNIIDRDEIIKLSKINLEYEFIKDTVVSIGRLTDVKRFDLLIKAHKLLIEDGLDANLIILGDGELRYNLENLIKELNLQDSIKLLGFCDNPYPYIKNAKVYAMASDHEGFSLVIAEALTLGKAIVSTNCIGPAELLGNGKYGELVDIGNEYMIKEKIKDILLNKEKREFYQNKALDRSKIFDKYKTIKQIEKILDEK